MEMVAEGLTVTALLAAGGWAAWVVSSLRSIDKKVTELDRKLCGHEHTTSGKVRTIASVGPSALDTMP